MVKNTLAKMLAHANKISVSRSKLKVSSENVEKVVKPPQNPTPINNFNVGLINSFSSSPNIIKPRIKLPRTFTVKVPYGKKKGTCLAIKDDIQYLNDPPIPAPINTVKYLIKFSSIVTIDAANLLIYKLQEKF